MLEALVMGLDDERDDSKEAESEIPEDDTLNQMLARADGEFEMFQRMDKERAESDRRELRPEDVFPRSLWNSKLHPERLIADVELPASLLKDVEDVEDLLSEDVNATLGKGFRERKQVSYNDGLTERQFLRAVESGNLEGAVEHKQRKRKRKEVEESAEQSPAPSSPADDPETPPEPPSKRRRQQQPSATKAKDSPSAPSQRKDKDREPDSGKKRGRKPTVQIDDHLKSQMEKVYDAVRKLMRDGRRVCELFITLPSKRAYPDYYQLIKNPIDLRTIWERAETGVYKTLDAFMDDMRLLVSNAQTFNVEGSDVYEDSVLIWKTCEEVKERVLSETPAVAAPAVDSEGDDESEPLDVGAPARKLTVKLNVGKPSNGDKRKSELDDEEPPRKSGRR
eukprot:Opistho-2@49144